MYKPEKALKQSLVVPRIKNTHTHTPTHLFTYLLVGVHRLQHSAFNTPPLCTHLKKKKRSKQSPLFHDISMHNNYTRPPLHTFNFVQSPHPEGDPRAPPPFGNPHSRAPDVSNKRRVCRVKRGKEHRALAHRGPGKCYKWM